MKKRICVCGGRDYKDREFVYAILDKMLAVMITNGKQIIIIHGGAQGADTLAGEWAKSHNIEVEEFKVLQKDYDKYGRAAPIHRNIDMLKSGLDCVIAFPGKNGTAHMCSIAEKANVKVFKPADVTSR